MILVVVMSLLTTATVAFAGSPDGRGPGGPGGVTGKVTAIGDDSLTVLTDDDTSVTVNTSGDTEVMVLATGDSGSLSDIDEGSYVEVRGPRDEDDDDEITAEAITILPGAGQVTDIDDLTITVEGSKDTTYTFVTTDSTTFRNNQD